MTPLLAEAIKSLRALPDDLQNRAAAGLLTFVDAAAASDWLEDADARSAA